MGILVVLVSIRTINSSLIFVSSAGIIFPMESVLSKSGTIMKEAWMISSCLYPPFRWFILPQAPQNTPIRLSLLFDYNC